MNKTALIILIISVIAVFGIVFIGNNPKTENIQEGQNVEIRDGVQFITINAKGGYSPRVTKADADTPTKLIVKTDGTYDCSLSLVIPSVKFQQFLPQTGETEIDLGSPEAGKFTGLCGMGMYSFQIDFI